MSVPADRKYAQTHEWFKADGQTVTIGITQFAADELTDITYVELPQAGQEVAAGTSCGEIESVKATAELLCAVSGVVSEVNPRLADEPELVNHDPFGEGWMIRVQASDLGPLSKLMDAAAYGKMINE
jgi:glycine cleavage system H protein